MLNPDQPCCNLHLEASSSSRHLLTPSCPSSVHDAFNYVHVLRSVPETVALAMGSQPASQLAMPDATNDLCSRIMAATRNETELTEVANVLNKASGNATRILYSTRNSVTHIDKPEELIQIQKGDEISKINAICVIENISFQVLKILDREWDLDGSFLAYHFLNPKPNQFWHYGTPSSWTVTPDRRTPPRFLGYQHLHGVFEYHGHEFRAITQPGAYAHRACFQDKEGNYPVQSNTKISYCLVKRGFCMRSRLLTRVCTLIEYLQTCSSLIRLSRSGIHSIQPDLLPRNTFGANRLPRRLVGYIYLANSPLPYDSCVR